jgi:ATP-binding cassette subfamily C protein
MLRLLDPSKNVSSPNKLTEFLNSILNYTGLEISIELILSIFAICLLLIAVLNYYKSILQASYQQEFSYATRKRLFKKIITSDWTFLNGKSKHNHIQVLTTEIPKMTTYYYFYVGLATKFIFILAYVLVALIVSVKFTLIVLVVGFLVGFFLKKYLKNAENIGNENIQSFRKMLKYIDDFWSTVKIAKVHNSEAFYYEKFNESNILMLSHQYKQVKNKAIPEFLFTISGIVSLIFVVYTAHNILHLQIDSLFVLILLFGRIFPQFVGINNDMNMLVSNVGSVKMVMELDKAIMERDFETKNTIEKIDIVNSLEIKNLNFSYGSNNPLFTNFSECIPANKITGIVGKSGCGKTTLIDIIAGLQKSEDAVITVDGVVLTKEKLPIWRAGLAYLPQDSFFIDGTLRENLIWDAEQIPTDEQIFKVLKQVNAEYVVSGQKQGLDTKIVNYQYHFSGGERQRLALARVLLRNPKLLLLDEATSSLDSENELQIMNCLVQLKNKMTIVFVTHHENLKPFFDKIISLK